MASGGDRDRSVATAVLTASMGALLTGWLALATNPPIWPLYLIGAFVVGSAYFVGASYTNWWPFRPTPPKVVVHERRPEQVLMPVLPGGDPYWTTKLTLLVVNLGSTSDFVANTIGIVRGVDAHYRAGQLAWEGNASPTNRIYGRDGSAVLVIADYDEQRRCLRFRGPESTYTEPGSQQRGKEVRVSDDEVSFELEIRDVETDIGKRFGIEISRLRSDSPTVRVTSAAGDPSA